MSESVPTVSMVLYEEALRQRDAETRRANALAEQLESLTRTQDRLRSERNKAYQWLRREGLID